MAEPATVLHCASELIISFNTKVSDKLYIKSTNSHLMLQIGIPALIPNTLDENKKSRHEFNSQDKPGESDQRLTPPCSF